MSKGVTVRGRSEIVIIIVYFQKNPLTENKFNVGPFTHYEVCYFVAVLRHFRFT